MTSRPPPALVYVAGPYRAATGWQIECNIQQAREVGAEVARRGAYPVIPHSNTSHFDGLAPDELWIGGTLELLRRCDAVIFCGDWLSSRGSVAERAEAERLGIPCLDHVSELEAWLQARFISGLMRGMSPPPAPDDGDQSDGNPSRLGQAPPERGAATPPDDNG